MIWELTYHHNFLLSASWFLSFFISNYWQLESTQAAIIYMYQRNIMFKKSEKKKNRQIVPFFLSFSLYGKFISPGRKWILFHFYCCWSTLLKNCMYVCFFFLNISSNSWIISEKSPDHSEHNNYNKVVVKGKTTLLNENIKKEKANKTTKTLRNYFYRKRWDEKWRIK